MKHKDWIKRPERFRAMTGCSVDAFYKLLPHFKDAHNEYLAEYQMNGKRRNGYRQYVMYKNAILPDVAERLAFVFSYLKLNPLQVQHADMFNIEQKQCNVLIHCMSEILRITLQNANCAPADTNKKLQESLIKYFHNKECYMIENKADKILIHDGTEREIPRPIDDDEQCDKYSDKKKKHTVKNAIIISACCTILFVSETFSGRIHDKTIADISYSIPAGFKLLQDTGYQGYTPEGVDVIQPRKKPKGRELTTSQKEQNRIISSARVRVEHVIGSVKRYRIVKDECRLRKNKFVYTIFATCAALHNFRFLENLFCYENKLT